VIPDVKINPKDALLASYSRALKSASDSYDPLGDVAQAQKNPAAALKAFLPF